MKRVIKNSYLKLLCIGKNTMIIKSLQNIFKKASYFSAKQDVVFWRIILQRQYPIFFDDILLKEAAVEGALWIKLFLYILQYSQKNNLCWSVSLIKKKLQQKYFPNIAKFLRTINLKNTCKDCFWKLKLNDLMHYSDLLVISVVVVSRCMLKIISQKN